MTSKAPWLSQRPEFEALVVLLYYTYYCCTAVSLLYRCCWCDLGRAVAFVITRR